MRRLPKRWRQGPQPGRKPELKDKQKGMKKKENFKKLTLEFSVNSLDKCIGIKKKIGSIDEFTKLLNKLQLIIKDPSVII